MGTLKRTAGFGKLFDYDLKHAIPDFKSLAQKTGSWRIEGMKKAEMRDGIFALKTLMKYAQANIRPPFLTYEMRDTINLCLKIADRMQHVTGQFDKDGKAKYDLVSVRRWVPWATKLHYLARIIHKV